MATARAYKTKTRIFKNAGYFVLTKRLADGTVSTNPEDIYTSDTAIVQSVTTRYSTSSEKMEDGNSFFPAAEHVTGVDAAAEIVLNTFDPKLWGFMSGATTKTAEGYYRDTADQYIIPDDGIVKLNASALKPESLVLARKTDGSDFEMLLKIRVQLFLLHLTRSLMLLLHLLLMLFRHRAALSLNLSVKTATKTKQTLLLTTM